MNLNWTINTRDQRIPDKNYNGTQKVLAFFAHIAGLREQTDGNGVWKVVGWEKKSWKLVREEWNLESHVVELWQFISMSSIAFQLTCFPLFSPAAAVAVIFSQTSLSSPIYSCR